MNNQFTPSRRDILKLTTSSVGSALFGSLVPPATASLPAPTSLAPISAGRSWEEQIHRASHIHERLGRFHHEEVFTDRTPFTTERGALVFLGRFAASLQAVNRITLPEGASIFNDAALAREVAETRKTIQGLSPDARSKYWTDIEFWRDQGAYGTNASEDNFEKRAQGKHWQAAVDQYFTKLERDLQSYQQYVAHLTGQALRSRELLASLDRPIASMGREWLDLFAQRKIEELAQNEDLKALAAVARTILPAPSYDRYSAASPEELNDSIDHLVRRGVSRVELELLGEPDARYGVFSNFLQATYAAEASMHSHKVPIAPPPAMRDAISFWYDEALALTQPRGESTPTCTATVANALARAERLVMWGFDDGYGGTDAGIVTALRRSRDDILLTVDTDIGSADRTTLSTYRDRYSGGRYYDQLRVKVRLAPNVTASDRGAEVTKAIAHWLKLPELAVQVIPSTSKVTTTVLIRGLTAQELAERLA